LTPASFDYVGRIGLGVIRDLPIYKQREPGLESTTKNRISVGRQVVRGAGGVVFRKIGVELKAKITEDIFNDLDAARFHLAETFPYFIEFDKEQKWIPWEYFYAVDTESILMQSGFRGFIYSKRFILEEVF
jgi:hypothetical protein